MGKKKSYKEIAPMGDSAQETIEEHLSNAILSISSHIDLINQLNSGPEAIEIQGDALNALHYGFRQSLKDLRIAICTLDNKYQLTPANKKDLHEKAYACKGCEKTYSKIDYMMLEDHWGDHPCTSCGSCEYTVTARDGLRTTEIGRQAA
ncbi:MAG: hypothetical protein L6290_10310 [Thermodesulfovibrionales bacterium]|nr:hypothetical protein [Thermodesulfovibrionales bacterium]